MLYSSWICSPCPATVIRSEHYNAKSHRNFNRSELRPGQPAHLVFVTALPRKTRRLAAAAVVGSEDQTLITAADEVQVRPDLVVLVVTEADVQSRRDVCRRDAVVPAWSLARAAVGVYELVLRPGDT